MFSKSNRFERKPAKANSSVNASHATKKNVPTAKFPTKIEKKEKPAETVEQPQQTTSSNLKPTSGFKNPSSALASALSASKKNNASNAAVKKPQTPSTLTKSCSLSSVNRVYTTRNNPKEHETKLEDLKSTIERLEINLKNSNETIEKLKEQLALSQAQEHLKMLSLNEMKKSENETKLEIMDSELNTLKAQNDSLICEIKNLENEVKCLNDELHVKQIDLVSLEELITIRDSLCKDLQEKLDAKGKQETELVERLELVKGHHSLALEANESIRKEYKIELDGLKVKYDEDKQALISKFRADHENLKQKHHLHIEVLNDSRKKEIEHLKTNYFKESQSSEKLMNAKLIQLEEQFREQIRLNEIQFEEESRCQQMHWKQQLAECQKIAEDEVLRSELEIKRLSECLDASEFRSRLLTNNIDSFRQANDSYKEEIRQLISKLNRSSGNREYEILIAELRDKLERTQREKRKYEMALQVSREALEVLGSRLLKSDFDVENLNKQLQYLTTTSLNVETELANIKNDLNEVTVERDEYREALANIINSKNLLDQAHNAVISQNTALMESLEQIESKTCEEVNAVKENLMMTIGGMDTEILLQLAADQLNTMEERNLLLEEQAKEGLVAISELPAVRKENEELMATISRQAAIIDKLKRDITEREPPKSPLSKKHIKTLTPGKENVSPLRERNY